ncbi:hypothetical protein PFISCL1PPCAC_26386 [Pristionchus fissidentatus]|uniref:Vitellogenin domain-containing protein n=1 Tax=Pristionchus fissidentatus TaxID=1538716 RepID=A0AAV5WSC7_9BILA|nr:hypothetical protein PFISCL1PPCAC_26386 [Pristionchus fissidentatus]
MRLLLIATLVAAAFAARDSSRWNSEVRHETLDKNNAFKPGFEYRFHLDSQVSNGLPIPGSQQSAMRTQSHVSLTFPNSETIAHLRIEKIRVASLHKEMEPKKIQPFELFEEILLNEEHTDLLRLPVRFRYESGIVSDIEFDRKDAEWSKNIKRTYLNMLQVNLEKKNAQESRLLSDSDKQNVYTAPETTLEGECEVTYTVVPESREESELRVTKSINFEKCSRRVGHRYNLRFGDKYETSEKKFDGEEREIESSTLFNYRILGTASRFLIKEVELRSVYSYTPLSKEDTLFTTFVSGNLRLVEITKEYNRISAPKSEKKETLLYSMEWEKNEEKFLATGDETLLRNSPYPEIKNKNEIVVRMLKSLVAKMEDEVKGIELSATHEMGRLVTILRLATKGEIKRMHEEICESRSDSKMKDLFYDALAMAGSFNTVEHLIERISKSEVSPLKAASLLKQFTNIRVPSEKMIDSLVSMCREKRSDPMVRQSCWLTVGALVNGVCGEHSDKFALENGKENKCPRDLKEKFLRMLTREFEILALKTLANSGMDLIVFPLEKIIKDERQEKIVRVQAIVALRKLRLSLPRKIVSLLLPLYKNTREHPEIRLASFHMIMQTRPEKVVIDQIIAHLEKEPSTQVYSLVYEALDQLSRSDMHKTVSENIKTSLKMLRPKSNKMMTSTFKYSNYFNEESKTGLSLNWVSLFSKDSLIPKELSANLESVFAGQWNKHLAQIGFSQHNFKRVLRNLFEKLDKEDLEEIMVRGKRSSAVHPTKMLRDLFSKLSIVTRNEKEQDPHAFVYIRYRDMDYALLPLDDQVFIDMFKTVLKDGEVNLEEIKSFFAMGLRFNTALSSFVYERSLSIVHSMGSPLIFSSKLPTIVKFESEIKMEVPKSHMLNEGAKFHFKALPTLASTHVTQVEMINPLVNLGMKLLHSAQMNFPVEITAEMRWENKIEFKTTVTLPKESRRLIQLQTRPVSFVRVWPKDSRVYVECKEKTVYVEEFENRLQKIDSSYLEKATGMKMNVHGHFHGHILDGEIERIPSALLIGDNYVEVTFEKTDETPKEYVFKTTFEEVDERKETPNMEGFYALDDKYFDTEENEEFPDKEKTRRGEFEKYVKSYKTEKALSHRIHSEVTSVGGRKTHKAEVEYMVFCDIMMRHCKLHLNSLRTPVTEEERQNWEMKSTMEILYPEMPKSYKDLLSQKHRELSIIVGSRWGSEEKNELNIKIQGEQNKEMKKWMNTATDLKNEEMFTDEEYSRLVQASMLNQYKMVAHYDIKSPVSRAFFEKLYSDLK